jgi:glycosyltransferase involved in cell wall biosynthesis
VTPSLLASLHLDAGRDFRGGQRQVMYLLQGLIERDRRVLLCCPRSAPLFARATEAGIPCKPLTLRSGFDFPSAVRLARLVAEHDFDLVHAHDAHSHSIARAAQGISHHPAILRNLFVSRRSIGTDQSAIGRLKYNQSGTQYIAISPPVRESLLRLGVDPSRIAVVPSGVDVERFAAAHTRGGPDRWGLAERGVRVVGTVGALSREKNHGLLLATFARVRERHPDAHLLVVGDGPMRRVLERRATTLGIAPHVTFAGHLDDVAPAYAAMHVFVLSSDTEGLCTSVLDAMSAGVPVAATAAGGVLEIARHGESALVVPPRDPEALANSVARLLREPELAARLVEGGQRVARRHSIERMVEGTLEAYAQLAAPRPEGTTRAAATPIPATGRRPPTARLPHGGSIESPRRDLRP